MKNEPAFPHSELGNSKYIQGGMTIRDYFAAKAIAASCQDLWNFKREDEAYQNLAKCAYPIADAMLAARSNTTK